MPPTPDSLFGLQSMGQAVELFKDISEDQEFSKLFESEECYADVYRYDKLTYEKSLLPIAGRASTSKEVKQYDQAPIFVPLLHIRVHKKLYSADLFTQRAPGEMSDNAAALVFRTREQLRNRIKLTIEKLAQLCLTGTMSITAATFPDTEITGGSGFAKAVTALTAPAASWNTVGSLIMNDVQNWRRAIRQASGGQIEKLMFNRSVTQMLLKNTNIIDWISKTQNKAVNVFDTALLGKGGGVNEWQEYEGFYTPAGGSATPFIADNECYAIPKGNLAGLTLVEGFGEIPAQAFGVGAEMAGVAGAIRSPTKGIFEYVTPIQDGDPPGVKVFAGWYGIPIAKISAAIGYRADVTSIV